MSSGEALSKLAQPAGGTNHQKTLTASIQERLTAGTCDYTSSGFIKTDDGAYINVNYVSRLVPTDNGRYDALTETERRLGTIDATDVLFRRNTTVIPDSTHAKVIVFGRDKNFYSFPVLGWIVLPDPTTTKRFACRPLTVISLYQRAYCLEMDSTTYIFPNGVSFSDWLEANEYGKRWRKLRCAP
jgi:hypothetical protein